MENKFGSVLESINIFKKETDELAKIKKHITELLTSYPFQGRLEMRCGPMFSGKTMWIRKKYFKSMIQIKGKRNFKCLILKPELDDRGDNDSFDSHDPSKVLDKNKMNILRGKRIWDMICTYPSEVFSQDKIMIDEGHMFPDLLEGVLFLLKVCQKILVAALDADSNIQLFRNVMDLVPYAYKVTKKTAVCVICGNPAPHTFRLEDKIKEENVKEKDAKELSLDFIPIIGGHEIYKPTCLVCYLQVKEGKVEFEK